MCPATKGVHGRTMAGWILCKCGHLDSSPRPSLLHTRHRGHCFESLKALLTWVGRRCLQGTLLGITQGVVHVGGAALMAAPPGGQ
uniref:Uncharacterized protein n=1 Tax=Tetradesmus obliquus TaxID=3088 RepID=A0A383WDI3_TETOB|eukprot:jgi/Sobl393_1/7052/SZX75668.1